VTSAWRRARIALLLAAIAAFGALAWRAWPFDLAVVPLERYAGFAAAGAFLVATSGYVVRGALRFAGTDPPEENADTGRAVGKIENALVLTLVLLGAYTALGLVFTAKSIVRWQDMDSENTTYYLTGSVANFTYSLLVGVAALAVFGPSPF
jgi:hypothetical protein